MLGGGAGAGLHLAQRLLQRHLQRLRHARHAGRQQRGPEGARGREEGLVRIRRRRPFHGMPETGERARRRLHRVDAGLRRRLRARELRAHRDAQPARRRPDGLCVGLRGRGHQERIAQLGAVHEVERGGGVAHGAADHALHAQAHQRLAVARAGADAAAAGLQPDQATGGGGHADRTAAVVGVRHGHDAGGHRRGRAPAGAARAVRQVPRVARRAAEGALGGGVEAEFRGPGAPQRGQAGAAKARHQRAVCGSRQPVAEQPAAGLAAHALGLQHQVLDEEGHAAQRTLRVVRQRGVEKLGHGVDVRVECGRRLARALLRFGGADVLAADAFGQPGGVEAAVVGEVHGNGVLFVCDVGTPCSVGWGVRQRQSFR
ncbi:hypothetical protein D3C85_852330 [compost metagenome]